MVRLHADDEVFCSGCGYWRPNLNARTGWCGICTANYQQGYAARKCQNCNRIVAVKERNKNSRCSGCRSAEDAEKRKANNLPPRQSLAYYNQLKEKNGL